MGRNGVALPYGHGEVAVSNLPDEWVTLTPRVVPPLANWADAVVEALRHPVGSPPLREVVRPGERVAIIVNDITRVVGTDRFLPLLLDELNAAGVPDANVLVVFATATHRKHTPEEQRYILGEEAYRRVKVHDHDCVNDDLVYLGTTSSGTRMLVNRLVLDADKVIATGELTYHQCAGYTGGRKSVMPGVSALETIEHNHAFMLHPDARAGKTVGNPFHEDMMECVRLCPPHFILNVLLNEKKEFVRVVAGHWIEAHEAGCKLVDELFGLPIDEPADLVVVSPGGYPRDISVYQSQKAMENASYAVREGGVVVMVAACPDGPGSEKFYQHIRQFSSLSELVDDVRRNFRMGPHKSYLVSRLLTKAETILVSDMPDDVVRHMFMTPARSVEEALDLAYERVGGKPRTMLMPYGQLTVPLLR